MDYITKYIYDFSKNGNLANISFIKKVLDFFIEYYKSTEWVLNIDIINQPTNSLASYNEKTKVIYINYYNLLYKVTKYIEKITIINDYNLKVLNINLYIVGILLHELNHVEQMKIKQIENNYKNIIYKVSNFREAELKINLEYYYNKYYLINPLEREATLKSNRDIILISKSLEIKNITNFYLKEYIKNYLYGYNSNSEKYPLKSFLKCKELNYIESSIINIKELTEFERRIDFGLKISHCEFYKSKEELKKLTLNLELI